MEKGVYFGSIYIEETVPGTALVATVGTIFHGVALSLRGRHYSDGEKVSEK